MENQNKHIKEIFAENKLNSWRYRFNSTSLVNQRNIENLILKVRTKIPSIEEKRICWYYFRRKDNNEQFAGIVCNKYSSLIKFRIIPSMFELIDKRIRKEGRLFFQGQENSERQINIIPENYELIIKCLQHAHNIST